jgi:hypothetical protein
MFSWPETTMKTGIAQSEMDPDKSLWEFFSLRVLTADLCPDGTLAKRVQQWSQYFDVCVDLTGFDASTALITGLRYAADNKLVSVEINGIPVFTQDESFAEEFGSFQTIGDVGVLLFEDALNLIRFVVWNQEGVVSPMGLRVEGLIEAERETREKPVLLKGITP